MAPILQDIALRLKNNSNTISVKRIDLHWIIEDQTYFEWFTKLLHEIKDSAEIFNYNIYFVDKTPDEFNEKLMYISTNVGDKNTNVSLLDNFWDVSGFGLPNWKDKLEKNREKFLDLNCSVFFSGPRKYLKSLNKSCRKLGIPLNKKRF